MHVELEERRRMRRSLVGIRDLDPPGVEARLAEIDREIARLKALLEGHRGAPPDAGRIEIGPIEIVPIGSVRAA